MSLLTAIRAAPYVAILLLLGVVAAQGSRIHKFHEQTIKLSAQLNAITTARDTQKTITTERIKVVKERVRHADSVAKQIEQAPLPGQCRTPGAVLQADL